jgi:heme o synthase
MKNNFKNIFKDYLELSKLKIMLPVSLTGFTGYFIFDPHFSFKIILVSTGILLMAISSSVLNQIQEKDLDSKMNRTRNRPVPSGKILTKHALFFFLCSLFAGIVIIYFAGNDRAVVIGLITIIWYNAIYTNLKKITLFAIVPGAVAGALPPLIGWVAAGGGALEMPIIFLVFLLFILQIPHFCLLIMKYSEDYKTAGIPSFITVFNQNQIHRLTFTWVITSVAAAIFLCYFEIIRNKPLGGILIIASSLLVWQFVDLARNRKNKENYSRYSILLNSYFLLLMALLISDRIIA